MKDATDGIIKENKALKESIAQYEKQQGKQSGQTDRERLEKLDSSH